VYVTLPGLKLGWDTTGDGKADIYQVNPITAHDYYAFGMEIGSRSYSASGYRYGFNGQEKVGELDGVYDLGKRMYNPMLGRLMSVDPLAKDYPWYTPYQFAGNTPIQAIDLLGEQPAFVIRKWTHSDNYSTLYSNDSEYHAVLKNVQENTVNVSALLQNEDVHGGTLEVTYNPQGKLVAAKWTGYKQKSFVDKNFSPSAYSPYESNAGSGGFGASGKIGINKYSLGVRAELFGNSESSIGLNIEFDYSKSESAKWGGMKKGFTISDIDFKPSIEANAYAFLYSKRLTETDGFEKEKSNYAEISGNVPTPAAGVTFKSEANTNGKKRFGLSTGSMGVKAGTVQKTTFRWTTGAKSLQGSE
jgi:RHS repeat-associated protein